jgi:hypothetical protein
LIHDEPTVAELFERIARETREVQTRLTNALA